MKLLTALFGLCLSLLTWAVENPLTDLQIRYRQATLLSATFRQEKQTPFISAPLISTGYFQFAKEKGLIWTIETPFISQTLFANDTVFIADRTGQWRHSENDPINQAVADVLRELFSANWKNLSEQFTISATEKSPTDKWRVTLTPTNLWMKKALQYIKIQGGEAIETITLQDNQDSQTVLTFSDFAVQNDALDEKQVSDFAHP